METQFLCGSSGSFVIAGPQQPNDCAANPLLAAVLPQGDAHPDGECLGLHFVRASRRIRLAGGVDPRACHRASAPRPPQVGLDAAGKTTILYKLKLGEIVTTIPTIGAWWEPHWPGPALPVTGGGCRGPADPGPAGDARATGRGL